MSLTVLASVISHLTVFMYLTVIFVYIFLSTEINLTSHPMTTFTMYETVMTKNVFFFTITHVNPWFEFVNILTFPYLNGKLWLKLKRHIYSS